MPEMNILHVNAWDLYGGASRAAYRIHHALLEQGVNSRMLVQAKLSDDHTVDGPRSKISKGLSMIRPDIEPLLLSIYRNKVNTVFSTALLPFSSALKRINTSKADIVHLHWIAGGMLRTEEISKINKPIVWSLHDDWAYTGGCHIKYDCIKFHEMCGACPKLGSRTFYDLSYLGWRRKKKAYSRINKIVVNCPSRWIAGCASKSSLLHDIKIMSIPNLINTDIYKPFSHLVARKINNISKSKKIILTGAIKISNDINKGIDYLISALGRMQKNDLELLVFGCSEPQQHLNVEVPVRYAGILHDDASICILYNAANVLVIPSLQENLSNVIMEALACGTPVVGFDIGGNSDMIVHQHNGYLARPFDTADLAKGIDWVLNHPEPGVLSQNAREKVVRDFDSRVVAKRYVDLYEQVLKG